MDLEFEYKKQDKKLRYENWFFDFETLTKDSKDYQKIDHTKVFLIYGKNEKGDKEVIFNELEEFFNWLKEEHKNKLIYFHNLSFDGDFIFKYLLKQDKFKFLNCFEKIDGDKKCYRILNNGNKIYEIEFNDIYYFKQDNKIKKKRYRIRFKCTYILLSSSINALGKTLGLNKLDEIEKLIAKGKVKDKNDFYNLGGFDMDEEIREAFIKYIKNDVEIARLSFINFKNNVYSLPKNIIYSNKFKKNCLTIESNNTIGGIVYKLSKNYIYNTFGNSTLKKYRISSKDYDLGKKFFYGGFTQFNPKYQNRYLTNIDGWVLDINSSYPFQMTKLLPIGKLQKTINKTWKHFLVWRKIKVQWIKIKPEYENFVILKNIQKLSDLRYEREMHDVELYYLDEEWEFIKKIYNVKIISIETYFSEAIYLFRDFITKLYELKEHYAKLKQDANKLTYKIMMNSLFGRQCMRKQFEVELWVDDDSFATFKRLRENDMGVIINKKKFAITKFRQRKQAITKLNGVCLMEIKSDKTRYTNILIGAAITSYARLQLWEVILKFGVDDYMYSDTDSIFLNTKKDINSLLEIDDTKLGAWSVDAKIKEGKILGAKRYAFVKQDDKGIKFALSGLNNVKFEDIDIDKLLTDDSVLVNGQTILERDDYGITIVRRDFNIKKGGL